MYPLSSAASVTMVTHFSQVSHDKSKSSLCLFGSLEQQQQQQQQQHC